MASIEAAAKSMGPVIDDYRYLFKVVMIGNAGVGKTCLVRRFTQGLFPQGQGATIGVDFMIKTVVVDGEKIKLQIWDTAGQERFRSITQTYYRSAHALVLVYDVSSQSSFDCLPQWLSDVACYSNGKLFCYLVGNKSDVRPSEREIPKHIGTNFACANNLSFIETSALEADNVDELFTHIAHSLTEKARESDGNGYIPPALRTVPDENPDTLLGLTCCKT